ncbi:MAG: IS91 family transposase [Aestuariibacter sp.]|nr:IS91 family transposase [Aestuariibacter sp.]
MAQPHWEVADIFRDHGPAWRHDRALSLVSLKAMSAIERCRSAELGGHVLRCDQCDEMQIAYNSCRNRHCPKCQSSAAKRWLEDRQADLLPVEYYHLVFTLPASIGCIAYQNPALVYDLLFKVTAQTLRMIAADPKHLGVKVGMTAVLHTWGSALSHHPHLHCIVPGGGLDPNNQWKPCKPGFFLPVRVLSRLFRRLFLEQLTALHPQLQFYGQMQYLTEADAFSAYLDPVRKTEWVVYAKRPFSGPKAVLEYLSRYTHRIAISNSRIIEYDQHTVTFKWKDYRVKGHRKFKTMTLSVDEFIRRFLMHVLPARFHRIRHFGLLANHQRKQNLQMIRRRLGVETITEPVQETAPTQEQEDKPLAFVCRSCGTPLIIIEILGQAPRGPPN